MTAALSCLTAAALLAMSLALAPAPLRAAGSEDGSAQTESTDRSAEIYAEAQALIVATRFAEARAMLERVTAAEPRNADAWNLLGFSSRKMGDLTAAERAYGKALKLNPNHLGALEYQGEMFILMGDGDSAKANLVTLQRLCGDCEEMRDLAEALDAAGLS